MRESRCPVCDGSLGAVKVGADRDNRFAVESIFLIVGLVLDWAEGHVGILIELELEEIDVIRRFDHGINATGVGLDFRAGA